MLLHFIFVIKEKDLGNRNAEFEYIKKMAEFFKSWIKKKFSLDVDIQCDQMITKPRGLLQRLDTHLLLKDHHERGDEIFHFYLTHFRPLWTDCYSCEGYFAENFGMVRWEQPKDDSDISFMSEKNCTVVSHEISHELLRQKKYKRFLDDVHEVWEKHQMSVLSFEKYDENHNLTTDNPTFQTIDTSLFSEEQ